jgi:hypothetical protein
MPNRAAAAIVLDHVHCRAICDEIGERLRYALRQEASDIPPRLLALIGELAQLEQVPSIVPSIEEMSFPGCVGHSASAKRSADLALPATDRGSVSAGS